MLHISSNGSPLRYVMVQPTSFHQHIETFVLDNTKWPHTFGNPLYDLNPVEFRISTLDTRYERGSLPSFRVCVGTMRVCQLFFSCPFEYCSD